MRAAAVHAGSSNPRTACDFALRPTGVSRAAPPLRVPEHCDRPQCDIAHQADFGHIPSEGSRTSAARRWSLPPGAEGASDGRNRAMGRGGQVLRRKTGLSRPGGCRRSLQGGPI
jgi:hypothetical protein